MRIAGYAALFGKPDAARDTIRFGAFAQTLAHRREPLPLFWQHRPDQRIGWIAQAGEDARGLRVIAVIDNPNSHAAALLRTGSVSGLSFGYRAAAARHGPMGRTLDAVELFEVSLVTHPLQHGARVHFISPEEKVSTPWISSSPTPPPPPASWRRASTSSPARTPATARSPRCAPTWTR